MPLEFAKLSATHFQTLERAKTVFFFPVGPLEDHGPHLPMGLDLAHATRLCVLAGERLEREMPGWKAVLMPSLALGVDANTQSLAVTVRAHVMRDWLIDACRSLVREGFLQFVCFSGNAGPRHLTAVEEAGRMLWRQAWFKSRARRPRLVSATSASVRWPAVARSPLWPAPAEHGGGDDTSIALAIARGVVDPMYAALPRMEAGRGMLGTFLARTRRQISGYWGEPARATAEHGEALLAQTVEDVFPKLRAVWEGANPRWIFSSWYGVFPPNRSFFRAWLLALAVALTAWLAFWLGLGGLG